MAAPVRHSIELQTVGELHVVLLLEPAALLVASPLVSLFALFGFLLVGGGWVLDELELFGGSFIGRDGRRAPPSPVQAAWRCLSGAGCGGMTWGGAFVRRKSRYFEIGASRADAG